MIQKNQFAGRPQEDPYMHLKNFIATSGTIRYRNVNPDQVRACLFQFSLRDQAREWFETLSDAQKANWDAMVLCFLEEFFSESKVMDYQEKISSLKMKYDEDLHEAFKRFKTTIRKCPQHGF